MEQPSFEPVKPQKRRLRAAQHLPTEMERLAPDRAINGAIGLLEQRISHLQQSAGIKDRAAVDYTFNNLNDPREWEEKRLQAANARERFVQRTKEAEMLELGLQALRHNGPPGSEFVSLVKKFQEQEANVLQRVVQHVGALPPGEDSILDSARAHLDMYTALLERIRELGGSD